MWQRRLRLFHALPKSFYSLSCSLVPTLDPVMISWKAHMSSPRRTKAWTLGGIPGPAHRVHLCPVLNQKEARDTMYAYITSCAPYPAHALPPLCAKFLAFANFSCYAILQFIGRSRNLGRQAPRRATEFGEWHTGRTRGTLVGYF